MALQEVPTLRRFPVGPMMPGSLPHSPDMGEGDDDSPDLGERGDSTVIKKQLLPRLRSIRLLRRTWAKCREGRSTKRSISSSSAGKSLARKTSTRRASPTRQFTERGEFRMRPRHPGRSYFFEVT